MGLGEVFPREFADAVDVHEIEVTGLGHPLEGLAFGIGEEFALFVQELEGVPLLGIVRGGEDDAAVGVLEKDGHFGRRSRGQAGVDHVDAAGQERTAHHVVDHFAGNARIAADHDFQPFLVRILHLELAGISRRESYDVNGRQSIAHGAANGTPDAGNGFDQ